MIDLSHLTEEEQGMILTVLRRDAELKKAEEARIRKLEAILERNAQAETKLKYLTGEWFYEAKSRRHRDKIHGSEIILASMKQRKPAGSEGSLKLERFNTPSSHGSDVVVQQRAASTVEAVKAQESNDAEIQTAVSAVQSPRSLRHNPFNRASLIVVEPVEHADLKLQEHDVYEGESASSLRLLPSDETSQTSSSSLTSRGSSLGLKPVPKKRTFVSRQNSQMDANDLSLDPRTSSAEVVPAPRFSRNQISSGSSNQSYKRGSIETPHKSILSYSSSETYSSLSESTQQVASQHLPNSSLERAASPTASERLTGETSQLNSDAGKVTPRGSATLDYFPAVSAQGSGREVSSSVTSARQDDISLPRSIVDVRPPVLYDLIYIDKSGQKTQERANEGNVFKLSTQTSTPAADEDDSISKVLDWFNRSTDSNDWLECEDGPEIRKTSQKDEEMKSSQSEKLSNKVSPESKATDRTASDASETKEEVLPHLKTFGESNNTYPKVDSSTSVLSDDGQKLMKEPNGASDLHPKNGAGSVTSNISIEEEKEVLTMPNKADLVDQEMPASQKYNLDQTISRSPRPRTPTYASPNSHSLSLVPAEALSNSIGLSREASLKVVADVTSLSPDPQTRESLDSPGSLSNTDGKLGSTPSSLRLTETSSRDKTSSPYPQKPNLVSQETTAEKIKQLKHFWSMQSADKSRGRVEAKYNRGSTMNKRFTKSEFDLSLVGGVSGTVVKDSQRNQSEFNVPPLNRRLDKQSQHLGTSREQFNTLREFWDDTLSDSKGSTDKPKSPKRKDQVSPHLYRRDSFKNKAQLFPASPVKSTQLSSGSRAASETKSHQDIGREEKTLKAPNVRSPKSRRDSFSNSSSSRMRRATSMFALIAPEETSQGALRIDVSPVHSQSRKQNKWTNSEKGSRFTSEDSEASAPLARAFVPTDYSHYLGMADLNAKIGTLGSEASGSRPGSELDLGGPVRSSTPVSSEERHSKKGSKMSPRQLWRKGSSSDSTGHESMSSTSGSWSNTRSISNRENRDDPLRKALRRAAARPTNMTKSMEDLIASLSPRQKRRHEQAAEKRRTSDAMPLPPIPSPVLSDLKSLKKMSKSVPSCLQKEDDVEESNSACEEEVVSPSMSNITNSAKVTSKPSLSGSVLTMYPGEFGNVEVQGNVQFSINYVQRLNEFHIFVAECRDLAAVDPKRGRSDPYVKTYLHPDRSNLGKRKTSIKKKTLNPTFNEILRYRVHMEYLRTQTLILSVWHHDTFGRNSFLGEVDVDLSKWDFDHTHMNYMALKPRTTPATAPSNGRGEMRLAVRFLPQVVRSEEGPSTGELHIWVKECKNLPLVRAAIDPYVKCFVLPDTSRKSRQKTRVLRRTADPVFNHTMVYDGIREEDLTEACVELTVWDRDRLVNNLLGGLRLGAGTGMSYGAVVDWMDSTQYEVSLWEQMVATPNEWVEDVLPLRMLNTKAAFK
ncbi:synaptotagmin-like protein 2 isoform X2 [Synchiropus splendidus]|uniref:synaptotagmin-like protein 2 isoform X2 n=1 Tax=Synchiropus splendidus TaxID=270530 RepID=UPI00237D6541|nr:synaptotagmin-like protein 2 isoform X2 [Synchiropus splendidus]